MLATPNATLAGSNSAAGLNDRAIATANELGLMAEEYDPSSSEMLGNFPQTLSHLSHLEATLALAATEGQSTPGATEPAG